MGDRAVYGFRENAESPVIYLYSHYAGEDQVRTLAEAISKAESRWGDSDYATRICVSQIIGNFWDQELGYGLSVGHYCHPDYEFIQVVDWQARKVYRMDATTKAELSSESFESFLAALALAL